MHKWQLKSLYQTFDAMKTTEGTSQGRLQGHNNWKAQQERAEKVDGWMRAKLSRSLADDAESDGMIESDLMVEVSGEDADAEALGAASQRSTSTCSRASSSNNVGWMR